MSIPFLLQACIRQRLSAAGMGLLTLLALPLSANAAIALQQSRVIFNGDKKSTSLLVNNQNPHAPYLAQGWIEDDSGKKINGPLLVLPPIQRIEPGAKTQIKIQGLPTLNLLRQDRETLFYLNLREIPPKNAAANTLNIALQNRIKVFYRPVALAAPFGQLATPWHSTLVMEKQADAWRITNPSAYYITLVEARRGGSAAAAGNGTEPITGAAQADTPRGNIADVRIFTPLMLAPGASETLPGTAADYGNAPVFTYLNDYGGRPEITFRCNSNSCSVTANQVPRD